MDKYGPELGELAGGGKYKSIHSILNSLSETEVENFEGRFWSKVDKSSEDCWYWTDSINEHGYGKIYISVDGVSEYLLPHRVSKYLQIEREISNKQVNHKCPGGETKHCVNPDHLYLGNGEDNMADMSKLTDKEVREIRRVYAKTNKTLSDIGEKFGCSVGNASKIVNFKRRAGAGGYLPDKFKSPCCGEPVLEPVGQPFDQGVPVCSECGASVE